MKKFRVSCSQIEGATLKIAGSKSESNRALLLQAMHSGIRLSNISDSDDSRVMQKALASADDVIDVGHAGTAMRFLTAYFSCLPNRSVTIEGSDRMHERPIGILVDALRRLGAQIDYAGREGYPPLVIRGSELTGQSVNVPANVSSQFISALLLIVPKLKNGLKLILEGTPTSRPYIEMTLSLLRQAGMETSFDGSVVKVDGTLSPSEITIESDWSSASYFYSIVAMSPIGTQVALSVFKEDSRQGDRALSDIYRNLGVQTNFTGDEIVLIKIGDAPSGEIFLDLSGTPDLAQTIAVTCIGLGIGCKLTGLGTLRIKETDRLQAMQTELSKFGAQVAITDDSLQLWSSSNLPKDITVSTYDDHRMALAFATLATRVPLIIENPEVVSKSYPAFWRDLARLGFTVTDF